MYVLDSMTTVYDTNKNIYYYVIMSTLVGLRIYILYTDTHIRTRIHLTCLMDMTTQNSNNNHISVLGQETHTKSTVPLLYEPPSTFFMVI